MKLAVIIPARKNSIRLKNKNFRVFHKISLFMKTLKFAKKIKIAKKIIVSSDNLNLLAELNKKNNDITTIFRPPRLASSKTNMFLVVKDILKKSKNKDFDSLILLQPTSPFREIKIIKKAIKIFSLNKGKKSVASFTLGRKKNQYSFVEKKEKILILNKIKGIKDNNSVCHPNGNFFIFSKKFIETKKNFIVPKKTLAIFLNKKLSIDIDSKSDWRLAKNYVR